MVNAGSAVLALIAAIPAKNNASEQANRPF
jgi:hypothetical protein